MVPETLWYLKNRQSVPEIDQYLEKYIRAFRDSLGFKKTVGAGKNFWHLKKDTRDPLHSLPQKKTLVVPETLRHLKKDTRVARDFWQLKKDTRGP